MNWWEFGGFASLVGFVSLVVNVSLVSLYELATGGSADLTGVLVGAFLTVFFAMIFAVVLEFIQMAFNSRLNAWKKQLADEAMREAQRDPFGEGQDGLVRQR